MGQAAEMATQAMDTFFWNFYSIPVACAVLVLGITAGVLVTRWVCRKYLWD